MLDFIEYIAFHWAVQAWLLLHYMRYIVHDLTLDNDLYVNDLLCLIN